MAKTVIPIELSSTPGIVDSSNATAITISSSEDVTLAGHLLLADSKNIKLGAGPDVELYHDGTNSYITNATGALKVATETSGIAVTIGHTTSEVTIGDNLTVTGTLTGNLTGNASGTAATVTGAAQSSITSLGTLTTLTVDNVRVNGTTIGHTDDTDLLTLADGILTVAGEVSMTTLDIGGTNISASATELNYVDGVTSAIQTQLDTKATTGKAIAMAMVFG